MIRLFCFLTFSALTLATAAQTPGYTADIDPAFKQDLARQAKNKVDDLGTYISIIADKESMDDEARKAEDMACKLFVSDSSKMEVSKLIGDSWKVTGTFTIRQYLRKLRVLKYSKVEVTWSEIAFIPGPEQLRRAPNGDYYGTIAIQQRFRGFVGDNITYEDITTKYIDIVLKQTSFDANGKSHKTWVILLGDIGVRNTL